MSCTLRVRFFELKHIVCSKMNSMQMNWLTWIPNYIWMCHYQRSRAINEWRTLKIKCVLGFHSYSHTHTHTKQSTERELKHICMPYTCDSYRHFNVKYFILTAPNINTFMPREEKKAFEQNPPSQKYVYKTLEVCVWRSHLLPFIVCICSNPHEKKTVFRMRMLHSPNDWLRQSEMYGIIEKSFCTKQCFTESNQSFRI